MREYRICLLPGDGIGPEVARAAVHVLEGLPLRWNWIKAQIGWEAYQRLGSPLPDQTLQNICEADATLFGAVTTPPDIAGYRSPVVKLRQDLDLFANIRPCRSILHPISQPGINLLIVRENTEDAYAGREQISSDGEKATGEVIITRRASQRIMHAACQQAQLHGQQRVTVVHKANILRQTSGLFRRVALEVGLEYPYLQVDELLVDACAMELIRSPQTFGVIVTTNLFGDILSDEASMLVGGLGVAYSGNIGERRAVFEPVHGSAPGLAGKGLANPLAMIRSAAMMLDYLQENDLANRLEAAVQTVIAAGQVTADLGGSLTTWKTAEAVRQASLRI